MLISEFLKRLLPSCAAAVFSIIFGALPTYAEVGHEVAAISPVFPSITSAQRSYLRFWRPLANPFNTSNGVLTLRIYDGTTNELITTFSGLVKAHSSRQLDIRDIELGANNPITSDYPSYYRIEAEMTDASFGWGLQHVVFSNQTGFFAVVQNCYGTLRSRRSGLEGILGENGQRDPYHLINVHTTRISQYPSSIFVINAGSAQNDDHWSNEIRLDIYDAANGDNLGRYIVPQTLMPGEGVFVEMSDVETDIGFSPSSSQYHVNVAARSRVEEGSFEITDAIHLYHFVKNLDDNSLVELSDFCTFKGSD